MSTETVWGLIGVFVGGAIPWLEAIFVIPAGIIAGLPALPVGNAGATGNILTIGLAAYAGEWFRQRWVAFRRRRSAEKGEDAQERARKAAKAEHRQQRVVRVMDRGGLPLLSFLSPFIGTQLCAVAAVAIGTRATPTFVWISAMTVLWCIVAAWATLAGFAFFTDA